MTPEKFEWTKSFLKSSLWDIVLTANDKEQSFSFYIPDKCITEKAPSCKIIELADQDPEEEGNEKNEQTRNHVEPLPPPAPKRKRRRKGPLVDSEVRRNPRF
jgi:hypothetical protein